MATQYYGGAPTAFQGGLRYGLYENALRTLIDRFGPEAAAPVEWGQVEGIRQRADLHPYDVAARQREQAGFDALTAQHGPTAGTIATHTVEQSVQAQQNEQRQRAAQNAAAYLRSARDRGGDLGAAFDRVANVLPALGLPTEVLPSIRSEIVANPARLDDLMAMLGTDAGADRALSGGQPMYDEQGNLRWVIPTQSGYRVLDGFTPASAAQAETRLQQGARRLSNEEARMRGFDAPQGYQLWEDPTTGRIYADAIPGTAPDAERQEAEARRVAAQQEAIVAIQEAQERAELGIHYATRALERMGVQRDPETGEWAARPDNTWFGAHNLLTGQARRTMANRPGTDTYEIQQDLERLKGIIGIDELLRIKRAGATLGQVTERELEMLQNMLASLEIERDASALRDDLVRVIDQWDRMLARMQQQEVGAYDALNQPPPGRYGPPVAPPPPAPGTAQPVPGPAGPSIEELLNQYAPQ